jgi:serine/threonine protein kinase
MTTSELEQAPAWRIANALKSAWMSGQRPDVAAALERYPHLRADKTALLDLIYEEFFFRRQAGEPVTAEEYQARFPSMQWSLQRMLNCDQMLAKDDTALESLNETELPWPAPGTAFGHCTLLRELGRGAFAHVYLATESTTGDRPVALKLTGAGGVEAITLGRLNNEHIVPIHWAGRDRETGFYVVCMPWLGSATLTDVLDHAYPRRDSPPPGHGAVISEAILQVARPDDPRPVRSSAGPDYSRLSFVAAVCRMAEHLLEALSFLHEQKLAHCDLKPSNILLTPSGLPLLLDFNLALSPDAVTACGIGGTPIYMAPEQIRGCLSDVRLSPEAGARADLFALGMILYEVLTGRHPLGPMPMVRKPIELVPVVLERQQRPIRPIRDLNPAIPPALAKLLHRCLAGDPNDRPSSAAEVANELRRFRQKPNWRIVLALTLLVLAVGGWSIAVLARHTDPASEPLSLSATGGFPAQPPDAQAYRQQAEKLMIRGWKQQKKGNKEGAQRDFTAAGENYNKAINWTIDHGGRSGHWLDYAGRGRALMLRGAYRDAASHFRAAKDLAQRDRQRNLGYPRLLACLACCEAANGELDLAVTNGNEARKSGFKSLGLLNNLGYIWCKKHQHDQAERFAHQVLEKDPDFLPALRTRIELRLRRFWQSPFQPGFSVAPETLWSDIERAIALSRSPGWSESVTLYLNAAHLAAHLAKVPRDQLPQERQKYEELAWQYVHRARLLGAKPDQICGNETTRSDIGPILARRTLPEPQQQAPPAENLTRLADPLDSPLP